MKDGKENNVVSQVQQASIVKHLAIIFPKVPDEVREAVAPLFREWADIAGDYERRPTSLRAAWLYLGHHPAFWRLQEAPGGSLRLATGTAWYQAIETGFEEDDYVWMEITPSYWPGDPTEEEMQAAAPGKPPHDIEILEHNYDEALVAAAREVHGKYRNDRQFLKLPLLEKWYG